MERQRPEFLWFLFSSVFNLLKVQPNYHLLSMCVIHSQDFLNYCLSFCMGRTWAETIQVFCFIFISDLYLLFWFLQICTSLTNALLLEFLKLRKVYPWIEWMTTVFWIYLYSQQMQDKTTKSMHYILCNLITIYCLALKV